MWKCFPYSFILVQKTPLLKLYDSVVNIVKTLQLEIKLENQKRGHIFSLKVPSLPNFRSFDKLQ